METQLKDLEPLVKNLTDEVKFLKELIKNSIDEVTFFKERVEVLETKTEHLNVPNISYSGRIGA